MSVLQFFDELARRLLQCQHLDALVTHQIDNRLRIRLALIHVQCHHTRILIVGIRNGMRNSGRGGHRHRTRRRKERVLPPAVHHKAGKGEQRHHHTT